MFMLVSLLGCKPNDKVHYIEGLHYETGQAVRIEIVDGLITGIKDLGSASGAPEVYVAPGLIDIQINGYMGVDFSDQELTPGMMEEATMALWKEGVTSYLPTVTRRGRSGALPSYPEPDKRKRLLYPFQDTIWRVLIFHPSRVTGGHIPKNM